MNSNSVLHTVFCTDQTKWVNVVNLSMVDLDLSFNISEWEIKKQCYINVIHFHLYDQMSVDISHTND
jgi:hypothetical protein